MPCRRLGQPSRPVGIVCWAIGSRPLSVTKATRKRSPSASVYLGQDAGAVGAVERSAEDRYRCSPAPKPVPAQAASMAVMTRAMALKAEDDSISLEDALAKGHLRGPELANPQPGAR